MLAKALGQTVTIAFLSLAVTACKGDDDDDDDGATAANCPSICAQQDRLCSTTTDCASLCAQMADIVTKSGCSAQNQAGLDCLAEKNVCDKNETACPSTDLTSCIDAFCTTNPSESFCK